MFNDLVDEVADLFANDHHWPEPTVPVPSDDEVENWIFDSICEATDGCLVEPDGVCPHGHPSWLIRYGLI